MSLNEKVLEDPNWETKTMQVIPKGETVQVLLEREHKYESLKLVFVLNLDMSQADELGKRLLTVVIDNQSAV